MKVENPWNKSNWIKFAKDMARNGKVTLTLKLQPDVATGWWWHLVWTGQDMKKHETEGMGLDICLDLAIKKEIEPQQSKLDEIVAEKPDPTVQATKDDVTEGYDPDQIKSEGGCDGGKDDSMHKVS